MSGRSTRSGPGAGKAGGGDVMAGGAAGFVDASGAVLGDSALGRGRSSAGVLVCCGGAGLWPHSSHGAPVRGSRGGAGCGWCAALIAGVRKDTTDASFPPSTSHTHCLFVASAL